MSTVSNLWSLLSVLLHSLLGHSTPNYETQSGNRSKRIVFGEDLRERDSGYLATNYFVWISNKHICEAFDSFRNFFLYISGADADFYELGYYKCDVDPQKLMCGGSLLTPTVVQTACHCVGFEVGTNNPMHSPFRAKDAFTDMALTYYGASVAEDLKIGYISRLFVVHEKCHGKYDVLQYDYGLILLKTAIAPKDDFASNPLNFAPIYSEKVWKSTWNSLKSRETVCLFVGYGRFMDNDDVTVSAVMQHSWLVMQGYEKCHNMMSRISSNLNFSGSCFLSLPGKPSRINHGDSGSPITCNNAYVALVSGGLRSFKIAANPVNFRHGVIYPNVTHGAPIALSRYANTAESRVQFVNDLMERAKLSESTRGILLHTPHSKMNINCASGIVFSFIHCFPFYIYFVFDYGAP